MAAMSSLGLLLWLTTATSFSSQKAYAAKYLKIMGRSYNGDVRVVQTKIELRLTCTENLNLLFLLLQELSDFVGNFMRTDGVFTLRLIAKNTNDAITGEVSRQLQL